ncbi:MAG: TonB family protein [Bacteroidota bacterium]
MEGKVLVKTSIDEERNAADAEIEKGANKLLSTAAIDAVKESKFIPGEKNSKKIKTTVFVPIIFKLH